MLFIALVFIFIEFFSTKKYPATYGNTLLYIIIHFIRTIDNTYTIIWQKSSCKEYESLFQGFCNKEQKNMYMHLHQEGTSASRQEGDLS